MKKTFTIFNEGSQYLKIKDKIIGTLEGIQYDTKKFEGRLSIRKLDIKEEEFNTTFPHVFEAKIFQMDKKGQSNTIEIKEIRFEDKVELNKLVDFKCDEIIDTNKGIPTAKTKIVGKVLLD